MRQFVVLFSGHPSAGGTRPGTCTRLTTRSDHANMTG